MGDGAAQFGVFYGGMNREPGYGTQSNKKVWVMREFKNSEENKLGLPLPPPGPPARPPRTPCP